MTERNRTIVGDPGSRRMQRRAGCMLTWALISATVAAEGCHSKSGPAPARALSPKAQKEHAQATSPALDALPLAFNPLYAERPLFLSFSGGRYDAVAAGPFGMRIINYRRPEDMACLKSALGQSDGPRTVKIGADLPLRHCDYALMIGERLPGEVAGRYGSHSFNQFTPYERRDQARYDLLKRVFGVSPPKEVVKHTYLDEQGQDVSESYRETPDWP